MKKEYLYLEDFSATVKITLSVSSPSVNTTLIFGEFSTLDFLPLPLILSYKKLMTTFFSSFQVRCMRGEQNFSLSKKGSLSGYSKI